MCPCVPWGKVTLPTWPSTSPTRRVRITGWAMSMRDNGLEITPRGNGLVIRADDGTTVKPSTIARDLSKPALEKRLGAFEASPEQQEPRQARRSYQKNPLRLRVNTTELYARYKDEQKNLTATRAEALAQAKRRKDRAVADAKQKAATKRAAVKLAGGGGVAKKLLYAQTSATLRAGLDTIHKGYTKERERLYQGLKRRQRSEEHTAALPSLMRTPYSVLCLNKQRV